MATSLRRILRDAKEKYPKRTTLPFADVFRGEAVAEYNRRRNLFSGSPVAGIHRELFDTDPDYREYFRVYKQEDIPWYERMFNAAGRFAVGVPGVHGRVMNQYAKTVAEKLHPLLGDMISGFGTADFLEGFEGVMTRMEQQNPRAMYEVREGVLNNLPEILGNAVMFMMGAVATRGELSYLVGADEAIQVAKQHGASDTQATLISIPAAVLYGAIEHMQMGQWLAAGTSVKSALMKSGAKWTWREIAKAGGRITKEMVKVGLKEGVEEVLQEGVITIAGEGLINAMNQGLSLDNIKWDRFLDRAVEAGVGGALAGMVLAGGSGAIRTGIRGDIKDDKYYRKVAEATEGFKAPIEIPLDGISKEELHKVNEYSENLISKMQTPEGKAIAGIDPSLMGTLGKNLYSGDIGKIAVKEALQNAFDSLAEVSADPNAGLIVQVTIDNTPDRKFGDPEDFVPLHAILVTDNGAGMLPDVVYSSLVDIGGTTKQVEGSKAAGGFGIAKVAVFWNTASKSEDHPTPIHVRTTAWDAEKKQYVETIMKGSKEDLFGGGISVESKVVSPEEAVKYTYPRAQEGSITGTELRLVMDPEANMERWPTESFMTDFLSRSQLRNPVLFTLNGQEQEGQAGTDLTSVEILSVPGAKVEILASAKSNRIQFAQVQILNRGIYQFSIPLSLSERQELPRTIIANVEATSSPKDPDYPFAANRESLRDNVELSILEYVSGTLAQTYLTKERAQYQEALFNAPQIGVAKDATGIARLVYRVIDGSQQVPPELMKEIAESKAGVAIMKELDFALRKIVKSTSKTIGLVDELFSFLHLGGFGVLPEAYGIHTPARYFDEDFKDTKDGLVFVNLFSLIDTAANEVSEGTSSISSSDLPAYISGELWSVLLHEAAHQQSGAHTELWGGVFTNLVSVTSDIQASVTKRMEKVLKEHIYELSKYATQVLSHTQGASNIFGKISSGLSLSVSEGDTGPDRERKKDGVRDGDRKDEISRAEEENIYSKLPISRVITDAKKGVKLAQEYLDSVKSELVRTAEGGVSGVVPPGVGGPKPPAMGPSGAGGPPSGTTPPLAKTKPASAVGRIKTFLRAITNPIARVLEPAKIVEWRHGRELAGEIVSFIQKPFAKVTKVRFEKELRVGEEIKGRLADIENLIEGLDKDSQNALNALRSDPDTKEGQQKKAELVKALDKTKLSKQEITDLLSIIKQLADDNFDRLKEVDPTVNYVENYFFGLFKRNPASIKYYKGRIAGTISPTSTKFLKQKHIFNIADALAHGLELVSSNPITNLLQERVLIEGRAAMKDLRRELIARGLARYAKREDTPERWREIHTGVTVEPLFKDLLVDPDIARLVNNLISTELMFTSMGGKLIKNTINILRNVKFIGSLFHARTMFNQNLVMGKGKGSFLNPQNFLQSMQQAKSAVKKVPDEWWATRVGQLAILSGIHKRFSVEYGAAKAFREALNLDSFKQDVKDIARGNALKALLITPKALVKGLQAYNSWLFETFIPELKRMKFVEEVYKQEKKLKRELKVDEALEITKDIQNFFGEMDERIFGRRGSVISIMRLFFLAPGFREGNFRTIGKALLQGKGGQRSRENIFFFSLLYALTGVVGTMLLTGKPPELLEEPEEDPEKLLLQLRDVFRIKTGFLDARGKDIYIDTGATDKDYIEMLFMPVARSVIKQSVAEGGKDVFNRFVKIVRGMEAPLNKMLFDWADFFRGRAVYDWKNDQVYKIDDPTLQKLWKLSVHSATGTQPIAVSVFRRELQRETPLVYALMLASAGVRTTPSELSRKTQELVADIFRTKERQQDVYSRLAKTEYPREVIDEYNKYVDRIINSPLFTKEIERKYFKKRLRIDVDRYLTNKAVYLSNPKTEESEAALMAKTLKNFGLSLHDAERLLLEYRKGFTVKNGRLRRNWQHATYIKHLIYLRRNWT